MGKPQRIPPSLVSVIQSNRHEMENFPKDHFGWDEIEEKNLKGMFYRLNRYGVLDQTNNPDHYPEESEWKLKDWFIECIERYIPNAEYSAPCGRRSVRCLEAGEMYTCSSDECDCRFDREMAEKILMG